MREPDEAVWMICTMSDYMSCNSRGETLAELLREVHGDIDGRGHAAHGTEGDGGIAHKI